MRILLNTLPVIGLVLSGALLAGCATTQQADGVKPSGFLVDYSMLHQGNDDQALLTYWNPRAPWSQYKKIMIDPVAVYTTKDSELHNDSRDEQVALASYFASALREQLGKYFIIVNNRGSGVLRLRVALTDGDQSEVLLNTVSTVMPIGLALSTVKQVTFGSGTGVGFAQAEAEVIDSVRATRLAAAVDKRYGTKALRSKFGSWNDAQEAMDFWAAQIAEKLVEKGAGTKPKE